LDRLLRNCQAPLYRHACTITGDAELALDALQTSMQLIASRIRTVRDPRWFRAWAYRITTRESTRLLRRQGRDHQLFDYDVAIEALEVAEISDPPDAVAAVDAEWLDRLPPAAQIVVRLHYFDGMKLEEVAEALEIPIGTVKSRLAYGLSRLRDLATC